MVILLLLLLACHNGGGILILMYTQSLRNIDREMITNADIIFLDDDINEDFSKKR